MIDLIAKCLKHIEYNKIDTLEEFIDCVSDDIERSAIRKIKNNNGLYDDAFRGTFIYSGPLSFLNEVKEKEARKKIYTKIKSKMIKFKTIVRVNKMNIIVTLGDVDIDPIRYTNTYDIISQVRVDLSIRIRPKIH